MEEIWVEYHRNNWVNQTGVCKPRNIYEVSNFGRVRINGKVIYLEQGDGYIGAPGIYNGKRLRLHVLVASVFVPNQDNKPQVDHIDGDKFNNRADNLRWVTPKENMNNPVTKTKMKEVQFHAKGELNGMYGKHHTKKSKEQNRLHHLGQKAWNKGLHTRTGKNNPMYGKNTHLWVTNGEVNHLIKNCDLEIYMSKGYYRGQTRKK